MLGPVFFQEGPGMKRIQHGFTLIELMITVAIVGVLAAVALPAYNDYIVKAKISEVMLAASTCRISVSELYQTADSTPGSGNWGCESASATTQYVETVSTDDDGVITVMAATTATDLPATVRGTTIQLIPTDAAGTPLTFTPGATVGGFICKPVAANGHPAMPAKYLPGSCRG
jgi:type IV pilus assembly protein PilA